MTDKPKPPKVFANQVIRQIIEHMFADDFKIKADDYMMIRVVFRKMGGSWEKIGLGSLKDFLLLQNVIQGWSKLPHEKKSDTLI